MQAEVRSLGCLERPGKEIPVGLGYHFEVNHHDGRMIPGNLGGEATNTGSLYTVDPSSAASVLVGTVANFYPVGLARSQAGTLYVIDTGAGDDLYTKNTANGATTLVRSGPSVHPSGLAFSPDGILYHSVAAGNMDADLYTLDLSSGGWVLAGNMGTEKARAGWLLMRTAPSTWWILGRTACTR